MKSFSIVIALLSSQVFAASWNCGPESKTYEMDEVIHGVEVQGTRCVKFGEVSKQPFSTVYGEGFSKDKKISYRFVAIFDFDGAGSAQYGRMFWVYISGNGETRVGYGDTAAKLHPDRAITLGEGEVWTPVSQSSRTRLAMPLKNCGLNLMRWNVKHRERGGKAEGVRCTSNVTATEWVWYGRGWRDLATNTYEQMGMSEAGATLGEPAGTMGFASEFCGEGDCPAAQTRILFNFDPQKQAMVPLFAWKELWFYKR